MLVSSLSIWLFLFKFTCFGYLPLLTQRVTFSFHFFFLHISYLFNDHCASSASSWFTFICHYWWGLCASKGRPSRILTWGTITSLMYSTLKSPVSHEKNVYYHFTFVRRFGIDHLIWVIEAKLVYMLATWQDITLDQFFMSISSCFSL